MKPSISKMAIVSPSREIIWGATEGTNQVLWIEKFREAVWELTLQERHYKHRREYAHEALLQKAVCVIHPDTWTILTTQRDGQTTILTTGSGKKDIGEIMEEKITGLETGIAEQVFWECYAVTGVNKWPLYVFQTRIVMARTQGSVSSLLGNSTSWWNPSKVFNQVNQMEQNIIRWIALEVQRRKK